MKLLQFCSWENPIFSKNLLSETLRQIACTIYQDLKHYLDWLLHLLLIEDSWQTHRIHNALQGIPDSDAKEGLFDIVTKSKTHYQKKAYQCIKCMTTLFSKCRAAHALLTGTEEIRRKWLHCNEWFPFPTNVQYGCDNWLLPTKSNDSTNGYFPERSNSARKLLVHSVELCPQDEPEVEEVSEEGEGLQSLEWNGLVVSKYFGNASAKDRRKNRVQIRKVDETSEDGIAPMVELQQRSFKPFRRENNQRRVEPTTADSGDEEFSWFCGMNKRMSSPSDLPQSHSRHSLNDAALIQETQVSYTHAKKHVCRVPSNTPYLKSRDIAGEN